MILCSSCQHAEHVGALYCSECGMLLNYQPIEPSSTSLYPQEAPFAEAVPWASKEEPVLPSIGVYLKLPGTGQIIPLEGGIEFTLGRVSGKQPILPDIDLTAYQAYEQGVSRLHATIKIVPAEITITDLGAANFTLVNGIKIEPHTPHKLASGDRIELGKLKLHIIIQHKLVA